MTSTAAPAHVRRASGHAPPAPRGRFWLLPAIVTAALALALALAHAPRLAAGTVIGGTLLVLMVARPRAMLALVLLVGPLDLSWVTGGVKSLLESAGGLDMNGIRLMAVVGGLGLLTLVQRGMLRAALGRYGRWYVLFLVYAAATITYSQDPLDGVRLLLKLAYPFLIFVAVLGLVEDARQLNRLADWALAGAAVLTLLVNPLFAAGGGYIYDSALGGVRITGAGIHPAPWSFYLLMIVAMSVVRFATRRQLRYVVLAAAASLWIVLAMTRGAVVAGLAALAAMAIYSAVVGRNLGLLTAAVAVGVVLGIATWPSFAEKTFGDRSMSFLSFLQLLRHPATLIPMLSLSGREQFWPVIFLAFLSAPVFGLGLGSTTRLMNTEIAASAGGVVHNEYLRLATETGVVGVLLFAIALLAWWRGAARALLVRDRPVMEWAVPALAALVIFAVTSFSDNSIDYYASVSQYVAFLAAGAVWWVRQRDESEEAAAAAAADGEGGGAGDGGGADGGGNDGGSGGAAVATGWRARGAGSRF